MGRHSLHCQGPRECPYTFQKGVHCQNHRISPNIRHPSLHYHSQSVRPRRFQVIGAPTSKDVESAPTQDIGTSIVEEIQTSSFNNRSVRSNFRLCDRSVHYQSLQIEGTSHCGISDQGQRFSPRQCLCHRSIYNWTQGIDPLISHRWHRTGHVLHRGRRNNLK
jgi:hypothetical protein